MATERIPANDSGNGCSASRPLTGLTGSEAARLLRSSGPNEIAHERTATAAELLLRQFASPVVWLLLGAAILSAALREMLDAAAMATIVAINAGVGFVQEHRAKRALLALRSMTSPRARVIRDARSAIVPAREVVPGDLLVLEAGDLVAADAHLLEVHALTTNEAVLTGESASVEKALEPPPAGAPLAERHDFVFMGTSVATGTGVGMVEATGMQTELGRIAHLLATAQEPETPLQQRLARVTRVLVYICGGIVAAVATAGLLRGWGVLEVFMSAVSLAVAAVPEGLPAVVTIALAVGVQRMAARHVLVRRLPAVETLGCATVICTDKTGTLTTGVMTVRELWSRDHNGLVFAAAACCDAELGADGGAGIGDPTELAILAEAAERGIQRADIERSRQRVDVEPFDPRAKRMSVKRADGVTYVKGAAEVIVPRAIDGTDGAMNAHAQMAARGLRVLAVATTRHPNENDLTLLGLIGIADPPRTEAIEAVAAARRAGVTTVMITGDHPVTARAIAHELGILRPGANEAELVHARATPEDKLRIVRDWKARGHVVAMTGDGVNDAPALREAHIGIAMGLTGTEVTREASEMVLADDNFASIVAAIREGRGIFDNIRKTLVYLLTGNAAELAVMLVAALVGLPLPLVPLQLLWINIVTDGLPALVLVMDPPDATVLDKPPRRQDEPMLGQKQWGFIAATGAVEATVTLTVFVWALAARDLTTARSLAFSTVVIAELLRAFAARSTTRTFWETGAFSNLRLVAVVALSVAGQLALLHIPLMQEIFELGPVSIWDGAIAVGAGLVPVTLLESAKLVRRRIPAWSTQL